MFSHKFAIYFSPKIGGRGGQGPFETFQKMFRESGASLREKLNVEIKTLLHIDLITLDVTHLFHLQNIPTQTTNEI